MSRRFWGTLRIPVLLGVAAFCTHLFIQQELYRQGIFEWDNVVFDADPASRLKKIAHNWYAGLTIEHPNLGYLFSIPIRGIARALSLAGLVADEFAAREAFALLLAPFAAALKPVFLYYGALWLGANIVRAVTFALLGTLSFSDLVFGGLTDTHILNGVSAVLCFVLAIYELKVTRRPRWALWIGLSVFAGSITITNLAVPTILFLMLHLVNNKKAVPAFAKSFLLVAGALAIITTVSIAGHIVYKEPVELGVFGKMSEYRHTDMAGRLLAFPRAFIETILAGKLAFSYEAHFSDPENHCVRYVTFSAGGFGSVYRMLASALAVVVIALGVILGVRRGGILRSITLAAGLTLGFFVILFSVWGSELFLYSQNWQVPLLFVLFPSIEKLGRRSMTASGLLLSAVLGIGAWNIASLTTIINVLKNEPLVINCVTGERLGSTIHECGSRMSCRPCRERCEPSGIGVDKGAQSCAGEVEYAWSEDGRQNEKVLGQPTNPGGVDFDGGIALACKPSRTGTLLGKMPAEGCGWT